MLEAQWKALPDYMPKGESILPVCDVSGSMEGVPMDVCVALGLYLAERNTGPFGGHFITFSRNPHLQTLRGDSLYGKLQQILTATWGQNTNLEAVFALILDKAREHGLAPEELPKTLLILSDMQFDGCVLNGNRNALAMIDSMYARHGYVRPNIVFWNLRAATGVPAKVNESGVALVSGFSPSIMQHVLKGNITPVNIMLETLNSDRYKVITI